MSGQIPVEPALPPVRPVAICIFRRHDRLLVFEAYDPVKDEVFYRPLGGQIEFGEYSADTIHRELREEIGAEVTNLRFVAAVENIFTYDGRPGHEIVMVYTGDFVDPAFYARDPILVTEDNGDRLLARWMPLADFDGGPPLYPDGLYALLRRPPPWRTE
jgi:ADP-ribose pyrophosphatase YjhB (NUDIX family)